MSKKRGKLRAKPVSKKHSKKHSKSKEPAKPAAELIPNVTIKDALHDLEILAEEKKMEHKIEDVEKKEDELAKEEKKLEKETHKVEEIGKRIEKEVSAKPLASFNFKDLNKGIIGAFIGVVAHFGFVYGSVIAYKITTFRASMLLIFSYLLIVILMYETGYRDIKEKRLIGVLPKRATFIFITSIVVVMAIFFLFNMVDIKEPVGFFKQVAVTSVLASLGAGTADLLGKH